MDNAEVEFGAAVGLFNGEGSTVAKFGPLNSAALCIQVAQTGSPEVLIRFRDAMGGRGRVNGPYKPRDGRRQPVYGYRCTKYEDALWIVRAMWPWLSEQKRTQAKLAMDRVHEVKARPRLPKSRPGRARRRKEVCVRGHELGPIPADGGKRKCAECQRINSHEWYANNRERKQSASTAWRKANPERWREYQRIFREKNPEKMREYKQRAKLRRRENAVGADNQQGRPSA